MEGSRPAAPAEPGTLKTSLAATPGLPLAPGRGCACWHGGEMGRGSGVRPPIPGKGHDLSQETEAVGAVRVIGGPEGKLRVWVAQGACPVEMLSRGTLAGCPHIHLGSPGIDKLTEKSQVSEDGTLRSLEPAPPQSSADGGPAEEVGDRDSCSGERLGVPLPPGLCGVGPAKALRSHLQQRGRCPGDSLGTGLSQTPPLFPGHG